MHSFRNQHLSKIALPQSTVWLLADISEFKGKQQLYTRQSPQSLKALREMATVQSVESSITKQRGARTALIESAIDSFAGQFALTDLERACPGVSRDMIRRLLWQMRTVSKVECLGRGPGAAWRKKM